MPWTSRHPCGPKLAVALALCALVLSSTRAKADEAMDAKDMLVRILRHQEDLVRSAECWYEVRAHPTKPEMIPFIEEMCRLQGRENESKRFIVGERFVKSHNINHHWWRKGAMERFESVRADDPNASDTLTFDGHIMRRMSGDGKEGNISAVTNAGAKGDKSPFTFVYCSGERRVSDVVEQGKEYRISRRKVGGRDVITLSYLQTNYDNYGLELAFEPAGRVLEWRWYPASHSLRQQDRGKREINGICRLSDYRSHPDPDGGEPIWFPYRVEYSDCMGTLPNGQIVEWASTTVVVKDIKFNVDIPDAMFTQEFPPEAQVWDGQSGPTQRLLPPGVRPAAVFDPRTRPGWHWAALAAALVMAVVAVGYVTARVVRRRAARAA